MLRPPPSSSLFPYTTLFRSEPLTPTEDRLLTDLAEQVGLVLKNAVLRDQLLARLEEIRASRQRLVAAQDEERRRIERSEEHTSELQSPYDLVCRLLLEKKKQ